MTENPFAVPFTNRRYLDLLAGGVALFDGATGTQLARYEPSVEDYGGAPTAGLHEMLLFNRPDLVEQVHRAYLAAGAQIIKTNSFRANRITLGEFGVAERTPEINRRAARLARQVADAVSEETGIPRLVAGSLGPTGKLPSLDDPELSDVTFGALVEIYAEYAQGLLEGGVDLLLIETQQDLLELKAAVHGAWEAFRRLEVRVPIQAQMTVEPGGHLLTGPDVEAVVAALAALPVELIGMNCSTGPEEMRESVRRLLGFSNRPVSVMPNAGMPRNVDGRAVYAMAPEPFATTLGEFAAWGVRAVGGCCGTGPEHIAALKQALAERSLEVESSSLPEGDRVPALPFVAGNMHAVALHQEPRPLIVGERINTQGSRRARRLVLARRYAALVELAETQVGYGAHVLDVCVALTEEGDEPERMQAIVKRLALNTPAPLMFDSTDPAVLRAALETYPGRAILNSVNLEAGEAPARAVLELARDFGAAIVLLTIDEEGMARTRERKLAVARRLYELALEVGLPPHALIFDLLTFTLATGAAETADAAVETLEALRRIHETLPGVLTNLGVSNVSYGLQPPARKVLNSVFLYHAVQVGLDLAIVNPAQITPYPDIPGEARVLADDLIFNRRPDALARYVTYFEGAGGAVEAPAEEVERSPTDRLYDAVLYRRREGVEALVDAVVAEQVPLTVLNEVLLPAMKEVGNRFGAGELILPFVLKSAEVMRAAVGQLEIYLDQAEGAEKGTVVLATVFGDVHDIGKNLVGTILANNGYAVHDLGKQVPADVIVNEAVARGAHAIGLSALLVATSRQMRHVVNLLRERGLEIPVLIGGAAVNPDFALRIAVDDEGAPYRGGVHYCQDAFEALQVLEHVVMHKPDLSQAHDHDQGHERLEDEEVGGEALVGCSACSACSSPLLLRSPAPALCPSAPQPPFWGARALEEIPLSELLPLLNRKSLFRVGWGARGATGPKWETLQAGFEARLETMWANAGDYLQPQAVYGYFPVQADGDDLVVYDPQEPQARREVTRFTLPRQPRGERLSLADYFVSAQSGLLDVAAFQVVTVGHGATERFETLRDADEFAEAYFVHGLAAQTTEAIAEWVHRRIRRELDLDEGQGHRYSWGYPALPGLEGHRALFCILPAASALGMSLTSAAQLVPELSTAALVVHNSEAKYFVVRQK